MCKGEDGERREVFLPGKILPDALVVAEAFAELGEARGGGEARQRGMWGVFVDLRGAWRHRWKQVLVRER